MSDQRLRELERTWRETGQPGDHLAWLQERVRVGEVLEWESLCALGELNRPLAVQCVARMIEAGHAERERVELAASLGERTAFSYCRSTDGPPSEATAINDAAHQAYMSLLRLYAVDPIRDLGSAFRRHEKAQGVALEFLSYPDWRNHLVGLVGLFSLEVVPELALSALWNTAQISWVSPQCAACSYLLDPGFKERAQAALSETGQGLGGNHTKLLNALSALCQRAWPEEDLVLGPLELLGEDQDRGDLIALGWLERAETCRRFLD